LSTPHEQVPAAAPAKPSGSAAGSAAASDKGSGSSAGSETQHSLWLPSLADIQAFVLRRVAPPAWFEPPGKQESETSAAATPQ
jgi:hypothetical protein